MIFRHEQVASHKRIIDKRETRVTDPGHHKPLFRKQAHAGPSAEEKALIGENDILDRYVNGLKKRSKGRGIIRLRRLLNIKRTYPVQAFLSAITRALNYGMYDLNRLERMILDHVAKDFFRFGKEDD